MTSSLTFVLAVIIAQTSSASGHMRTCPGHNAAEIPRKLLSSASSGEARSLGGLGWNFGACSEG